MTREEAALLVEPHTFQVDGLSAVTHHDALGLLGEDRFAALLRDPIRKHGPSMGTIYPWNVVDALWQPAKGA